VADLCDEIAELEESLKEAQMRAKDSEYEVKYLKRQLRESQKREGTKAQKLSKNVEISFEDLNFHKIIKDMKNENDYVKQEVSEQINYLLELFDWLEKIQQNLLKAFLYYILYLLLSKIVYLHSMRHWRNHTKSTFNLKYNNISIHNITVHFVAKCNNFILINI